MLGSFSVVRALQSLRGEVRKALANQLVDGGFTYRRMVLATVPLLWSLLPGEAKQP